ncbi:SIMPL domain-containing protein [Candidatus Woesearchaeota archaeon]|nr:SIMPL domain-containing protein [Candidatus Woesearchaeota archaeon]MBW3016318.1 SIMPL domain-containing protein [Candidatus Woesearchaeota archaeon]
MEKEGQVQNAISVQGSSEFDVAPDLAKIRFRILTQSATAQDAQLRNREIGANVASALKQAGVRDNEIETTDYRIEKIQEWDPKLERMVDKGYRATNAFVVTTKDLQKVGSLLDVGVQAGANNVDSINFELSDDKQKEAKTEALRKATKSAREKADALADGAGVRIGKVLSLSESSYFAMPSARYDVMAMKAEMGGAPETEISPQSVRVSAQVSVSYEIA